MDPNLALNPFPGLRSFQQAESDVFFGRRQQIDSLVRRLSEVPLVAVAGSSGCGKSSLVVAGLLRALAAGREAGGVVEWRPAVMRPGNDPIGHLAAALAAALAPGQPIEADRVAALGGRLHLGAASLAEAARTARLPADVRLLIVVDQFEELFRYSAMTDADESSAFVKLLLDAANSVDVPVSVVLTLRSDSLGHCADFVDLAEAVSRGQFLVPRMTREQRKQAIVGPVEQRGFEIAPRLVQRVLNDVTDDFDDLPVMQHALAATWRHWAAACQGSRPLDVEDYEAIGTARRALSQHADEAFESLPGRAALIERIFKALTWRVGGKGSEVRHPLAFAQLCRVTEAPAPEVAEVVERYRRADTVFLLPAPDAPLGDDAVVDVSHESLIRGWTRLTAWAEEEAQSAQVYRRLADAAALNATAGTDLLRDRALQVALEWREHARPNAAWARRYEPEFERAMAFLDASQRAHAQQLAAAERARRRRRRINAGVLAGTLAVAAVMSYQWYVSTRLKDALAQTNDRIIRTDASRRFALQSSDQLAAGRLAPALLLGAAALNIKPSAEEAQEIMRKALADAPLRYMSGHRTPIADLAFAPGGASLASVSKDGRVQAWRASDGMPIGAELRSADDPARATDDQRLGFGPDGTLYATSTASGAALVRAPDGAPRAVALEAPPGGSAVQALAAGAGLFASTDLNGDVLRWDLKTGQRLPVLSVGVPDITSIALSPDGQALAVAYRNRTVRLWSFAGPAPTSRVLAGHRDEVTVVAFSPDGATLASASSDRSVILWGVRSGKLLQRLNGHEAQVDQLAFSADGSLLASGAWDGTGIVWQVANGVPRWRLDNGHAGRITSLAFSHDHRTVASGGIDKAVILWDIGTPHVDPRQRLLKAHDGAVDRLAFSDDGQRLASAGRDNTVILWDVSERGARHGVFDSNATASVGLVTAVAFDPGGASLALASEDATVRLWDVARGGLRPVVLLADSDELTSVAFSPDGTLLAAAGDIASGDAAAVRLWHLGTGEPLDELPRRHAAHVGVLAFNPARAQLASGGRDGVVMLWDLAGADPRGLPAQAGEVNGLAFSPDGRRLASGGWDRAVTIWDLDTPAATPTKIDLGGAVVTALAFSPDGATLIVASRRASVDGSIRFFDWRSRGERGAALTHRGVGSIALDPTGTRLVSGGLDRMVRLWDVATRKAVGQPFTGHDGAVLSVSLRSDGRTVASAGADHRVVIWDADIARWHERACSIVGPGLESKNWSTNLREALERGQSACSK